MADRARVEEFVSAAVDDFSEDGDAERQAKGAKALLTEVLITLARIADALDELAKQAHKVNTQEN